MLWLAWCVVRCGLYVWHRVGCIHTCEVYCVPAAMLLAWQNLTSGAARCLTGTVFCSVQVYGVNACHLQPLVRLHGCGCLCTDEVE